MSSSASGSHSTLTVTGCPFYGCKLLAGALVALGVAAVTGAPRFGRPYGAWTGLGILVLWTAAALIGGYLVLRRRDG